MTIACTDVRRRLSDDLQLQKNDKLCAQVREHLAVCTACSAFRRSLRMTIDRFKAYDATPPSDLHSLVLKRLRDEGLTERK
jgi:predicted anti-sigma-YlaC factor YlaD